MLLKETLSQKRQQSILLKIDELGYASRNQLERIFHLGSTRNAQRILKEMSPYLNHFRYIDNVYYLNKKGREMIGSETVRNKPQQVEHVLLRNEVYLLLQPSTWEIEQPILVDNEPFIVPDAKCQTKNGKIFVEVDHKQKMIENKKKIKRYEELNELYKANKRRMPRLMWITSNEYRRGKLREYCQKLDNVIIRTKEDL